MGCRLRVGVHFCNVIGYFKTLVLNIWGCKRVAKWVGKWVAKCFAWTAVVTLSCNYFYGQFHRETLQCLLILI